jgi:hypothetical protein
MGVKPLQFTGHAVNTFLHTHKRLSGTLIKKGWKNRVLGGDSQWVAPVIVGIFELHEFFFHT